MKYIIKNINIANAAILPTTTPMITPIFFFDEELDEFEIVVEALPTFKLGFPAYLSKKKNTHN